jgi:3-dehydroquinate dehydratase type I
MMTRPSFVKLPKPFLVSVVTDPTPDDCLYTIRNSEFDGAQAYDLHLRWLEKRCHNREDLRTIFLSTHRPVMCLYYREGDAKKQPVNEEERAEVLLNCIRWGASAIDMQGDLFDPSPLELTRKPGIIDKQKKFIDEVHKQGGEVIMSSHTYVVMSTEQVVEHMKAQEVRGADMVKVAARVETEDDLLEAFRTTVVLKRELKIPFIHICMGEYGKIHRIAGAMLGSSLVFCVQRYGSNKNTLKDQPILRATREVFNNLSWQIARNAMEQA